MPEAHFFCQPIVIEYLCDKCGTLIVYQEPKVVGPVPVDGFRHVCPECNTEYTFPVKVPMMQHMKFAPIVPSRLMLSDESNEN